MSLDVSLGHRFDAFHLDAAFAVGEPGVTALFGPSGAGKTTIVDAIAGLMRPQRGRITINGDTVFDSENRVFVPARRRRVGYVFQDARLFPHLTVRANLEFGARRAPEGATRSDVDRFADLLGIAHLMRRRPARLSGGEKQRVALGRAILSRPRILLLDEPLAALDHARKAEILPYFERLRDEARLPIVYVSHSLDEVTRLADAMVVLNHGTVAAQGTVHDIMSRLDLFPLTGRFEAGAVLDCRVAGHSSEAESLTELTFDDGRLWVPRIDAQPGATIRLRIRARDVMIALREPVDISANNVIAGTVADIRFEDGPYLDIQVACGTSKLIARITRRSYNRLSLDRGQHVFALIKSVTVDRHTMVATGDRKAPQ